MQKYGCAGKGEMFRWLSCGAEQSKSRKGSQNHQEALLSWEPASGTEASSSSGETQEKS